MPIDPYLSNLYQEATFSKKLPLWGRLVVVLRGNLDRRGLELIPHRSRAVRHGEVHELIATDEATASPGQNVNAVANLGFVEFQSGGVLLVGDSVWICGRPFGHLVGFDLTHMPNHMNIVISVSRAISGEDLGLAPGSDIAFFMTSPGKD